MLFPCHLSTYYTRHLSDPPHMLIEPASKKGGGLCPSSVLITGNWKRSQENISISLVPFALLQLREATISTKLNLPSAYDLVRIKDRDEWKMGFSNASGHYEYCAMPYRLSNGPAVYQTLINDVLRDMGRCIIMYIDDILIYSSHNHSHINLVTQIQKLQENQLSKVKGWIPHNESFLSGIQYRLVEDWATSKSIKELQHLLGFKN